MENLAGNYNCDQHILRELERARIPAVRGDPTSGEVPYSVTGKLGPFTFKRAWRYWMVSGPVPLNVAEELYADPVGKTDVRAGGDCACRPPETWARWLDAQGRQLFDRREEAAIREQCEKSPLLRKMWREHLPPPVFVDNPKAVGVGFVESYHIDSEVGLRLFADTLRKHGLVGG